MSKVEINGKEFTGWKAWVAILLLLALVEIPGFIVGWEACADFHHVDLIGQSHE